MRRYSTISQLCIVVKTICGLVTPSDRRGFKSHWSIDPFLGFTKSSLNCFFWLVPGPTHIQVPMSSSSAMVQSRYCLLELARKNVVIQSLKCPLFWLRSPSPPYCPHWSFVSRSPLVMICFISSNKTIHSPSCDIHCVSAYSGDYARLPISLGISPLPRSPLQVG